MEYTDPKHVRFVLDTGHITMTGIDPIALARRLGHRIVELDTSPWRPPMESARMSADYIRKNLNISL
jgi:sugar phosphate isomerase/epimerase